MLLIALCLALVEPPLADQIARIETDFAASEKSFYEELRAAPDREAVTEANKNHNAKWDAFIKQLNALIKSHPDDPAAVDGLILLTGDARSFLDDEGLQIALRNRDDPRMGQLCFNVMRRDGESWAEAITKAVAESNPSREVRGQAVFCRGYLHRAAAFPYGQTVPEKERDELVAKARVFFNEVVEKYADVKTPDGKATIGAKAASELRRFDNLRSLKVGGAAPEIEGVDLDGKPLKLSDHRGKVVLVVFWGSWCGPCMAMVPHERALWERHRDKPFMLLGVNCGDTIEDARKTAADKRMDWPSFYGGEETRGLIATSYDVQQWPTVYVIDAQGVIRHIDPAKEELDKAVEALLAELK